MPLDPFRPDDNAVLVMGGPLRGFDDSRLARVCAPAPSYATGTVLVADGGYTTP